MQYIYTVLIPVGVHVQREEKRETRLPRTLEWRLGTMMLAGPGFFRFLHLETFHSSHGKVKGFD